MKKLSGKEMAESFSDFINVFGNDANKEFVEHLCYNTHRTLQQSAMRVFMECMKTWAKMYDNRIYDLRNEQCCKLAKEIVKTFEDDLYMPMI